jgi:hypothetical protein
MLPQIETYEEKGKSKGVSYLEKRLSDRLKKQIVKEETLGMFEIEINFYLVLSDEEEAMENRLPGLIKINLKN